MKICDNRGELIGEINVIIRPGEGVITTAPFTPVTESLPRPSPLATTPNVKTETTYGGKILP